MLQLATRITTRWPTLDGVIVTLGAQGLVARYKATPMMASFANLTLPAFPCTPIDTTGAGDTFIGYFVAAMSGANHLHDANDTASEESIPRALRIASVASSLCVERHGAMTSIPRAAEVSLRCKELGVL